MARPVDAEQHAARRRVIIDAALTCFAADGYDRATTAAICREAGIGSGTFFHYFPTKLGLLLAILDLGAEETRDWFATQEGRGDPAQVVIDYVEHAAAELTDPRLPGFVRAVGALMGEPDVAAALARDDATVRISLGRHVAAAQRAGVFRTDLTATRLTEWLVGVIDGYVGRLASAPDFDPVVEKGVLADVVVRLTRPEAPRSRGR